MSDQSHAQIDARIDKLLLAKPLSDGNQTLKKDAGKLRWTLFTWKAAEWVMKVIEFGARKYSPNGWRNTTGFDDWKARYTSAAQRHLIAYMSGEYFDQESGLPHLAHLGCNINFLLELDPPPTAATVSMATVK